MGTLKSISIGQAHETFMTLVKNGMTPELAKNIAQSDEKAKAVVQIASGNYELVLKQLVLKNLEPQGELVIPKTNLKKAEVFKHRGGGNNQQYHYDSFKNILLAEASKSLESSEMRVQEYKMIKGISCFDIRDELGGEAALCVSSYDEGLIVLHHIMQNKKYRDGKANLVYFMLEGVLYYVRCYWHGVEWHCFVNRASSFDWSAGYRVFSFAKIETQS